MSRLFNILMKCTATILFFINLSSSYAQTSPLGTDVVNVATVSYDHPSGRYGFPTNEARFTVVAKVTPSTIEFYRHAPNAPDATGIQLYGSDYIPTGELSGEEYLPVDPGSTRYGAPIDFSRPVPLVPSESFYAGELIFVRVTDEGQNGDPEAIETIIVRIQSDAGDEVVLRLYESGPDTGSFFGYVPSTPDSSQMLDSRLTTHGEAHLEARYVDAFDSTEISIDTALVDPFGRLFDSLTGELINGAEVTIVDAATGEVAMVYGLDGMSSYPSTIITGSVVTDESGAVYELEEGQFLFPLMVPGSYRLVIEPPAGYVFPSGLAAQDFASLANGPFEIIDGSYGLEFRVSATGPLHFDVPLDTTSGITITKQAGLQAAAIGDFVPYTLTVDNAHDSVLPVLVEDVLPFGLRYQAGSATIDNVPAADPKISEDGRTLLFDGGQLGAGDTLSLAYVAAIGPGTKGGEVVNSAVAVNPANRPISNTAEAAITIREDLLRSELTIVGRVAADACEPGDEWARETMTGESVAGVRLYMETGDYAITDERGMFHFQGVKEGTHVVQIDPATLPEGYEPVICEENTRFAGSAISQFVDAMGGTIWQANFYLKKTSDAPDQVEVQVQSDVTEYLDFDQVWLDGQTAETEWAYPAIDAAPSSRSVNLGIKTAADARIELFLNDRPVPGANRQGRLISTDQAVVLRRWRGVDIEAGENRFEAKVTYADGQTETLSLEVWFVSAPQRATLVDDQSVLVADGRTTPVISVRLENAAGKAVHAGRIVAADVGAPYRLATEGRRDALTAVSPIAAEVEGVVVGSDGIVRVELEPTLHTGKVRIRIPLADGEIEEIEAYLQPEQREWIVVGLLEGELHQGKMNARSFTDDGWDRDGRIAFFAKGMVKGDWLLTVAADTAKRRGAREDQLYEQIDPNAYYTLYGDQSVQGHDAESRYPVYVKLEKGTAQILFGDFATDLNDTDLARYNRQLSGVRAISEGERLSASGFVAETRQGFAKDEIPADGTSGPYRLSHGNIVRNSEVLSIETRDRDRPDIVLGERTMQRYFDYEIDYATGEIIFRAPVDTTDGHFNENVIIADYETFDQTERNLTYGGRAAVRSEGDRLEIGATVIREETSGRDDAGTRQLGGVDLTFKLSQQTEIRAEYAVSESDGISEDVAVDQTGEAFLVEVDHKTDGLGVQAYIRQEGEGFGIGQSANSTRAIRRAGVRGNLQLQEFTNPETGARGTRQVTAQLYEEVALETDEQRTVGEVSLQQSAASLSGSIGLRSVSEELNSGNRETLLGTLEVSKVFVDRGLTLTASHETPLNTGDEGASIAPERTVLGADQALGERIVLNLRHEILQSDQSSGNVSRVGVTYLPWAGGSLFSDLSQITQDSSDRLSATIGVDQSIRISEHLSASLGMSRRSRIDGSEGSYDPVDDDVDSPLSDGFRRPVLNDDSYSSAYAGLGYRDATSAGSMRAEFRKTDSLIRTALILGAGRELSESLSYAGGARLQWEETETGSVSETMDARLGMSWRPEDGNLIVFDRFDFNRSTSDTFGESWKLVNNAGANFKIGNRNQLALFHGVKYAEASLNGQQMSGWTNLLGLELRHDVRRNVDVGLRVSTLTSTATSTTEYQFGPSIGFAPKENAWISVGYNIVGFHDADFENASESGDGFFIRARMKLDHADVADLVRWIAPN